VQRLGAGRVVPGGPVSAHAGLESHAKLGDAIAAGQPLFTLFTEDTTLLDQAHTILTETLQITDAPRTPQPLIHEVITKQNGPA
jgi:pyrimidine-nucleoside phosphorylase